MRFSQRGSRVASREKLFRGGRWSETQTSMNTCNSESAHAHPAL